MASSSIDVVMRLRGAAAYSKAARGAAKDTEKIGSAGKRAGKGLDAAGRASRGVTKGLKRAGVAAAGAAGAYASIAGAKSAISTTTDLAKTTLGLHNNLDLSLDSASQWAGVAKARGVDAKALNMSFGTLSKNITAAQDPTSKQADLFKSLGLSQAEITEGGKDFNSLLMTTADGFKRMGPGSERTAASMKLFGRGWQTVVPLMRDGSVGLQESLDLVDKYGASLKGMSKKEMKDLIQTQRESKMATLGLQLAFGRFLAPALTSVLTKVNKFVAGMRSGKGAGGEFAKIVKDLWVAARPVVTWFGRAAVNIARFGGKHPSVTKLATAVGLVMLALRKVPGGGFLAKKILTGLDGLGRKLFSKVAGPAKTAMTNALGGAGTAGGEKLATTAATSVETSAKKGRLKSGFKSAGKLAGAVFAAAAVVLIADEIDKALGGVPSGRNLPGGAKKPGDAGHQGTVGKALGLPLGFAAGGLLTNVGIVGERGPELAQHTSRGTVITPVTPHLAAAPAGGIGGGFVEEVTRDPILMDGRVVGELIERRSRQKRARA